MASVAFAYGYPRFWKGDTNYPLVYGKKDYAFYLDKNSIKIKLNDPPYYIITARTITVYSYRDYAPGNEKYSNDREATGTDSYELFYDEKEMDMRVKDSKTSVWRYLRPQSDYIMQGQSMYVGEAVFYVVTRRKFYGNYLLVVFMVYFLFPTYNVVSKGQGSVYFAY